MMVLKPERYRAAIFDLDGIVTQTAAVHALAWEETFNEFLGAGQPRFSSRDYRLFVDGKPRDEGVNEFLRSRGITLPWGEQDDSPDKRTVCGLGNRKNQLFLEKIKLEGIEVYLSSIELVKEFKKAQVKVAVVTSSKNCTQVLAAAGLTNLFDIQVDGLESERWQLAGKPRPDVFLEAAARLGASPAQTVIFEDAVAGVMAGKAGGFALVVGVNRLGREINLIEAGADIEVSDLAEIAVQMPDALPLAPKLRSQELALFLDYDGTLTPIVSHPQLARLGSSMRRTLERLSHRHVVAVVSGRDRRDVEAIVDLPELYYAGSHGFDIGGPGEMHFEYPPARQVIPQLESATVELEKSMLPFPGAWVERKRFAVAVHYRQVAEEDLSAVDQAVDRVHRACPGLKRAYGKKIFELKPDMEWDKGRAIQWLINRLELHHHQLIYIGDDVTDEDAFRILESMGIGICVQESYRRTAARFVLHDIQEVESFLQALVP